MLQLQVHGTPSIELLVWVKLVYVATKHLNTGQCASKILANALKYPRKHSLKSA